METLGLTGNRQREDNFFQRLFWPTVQNHYDIDTLSRRGFWLAFVVGFASSIFLLIQEHPLFAMFTLAVFLLGAFGIRERSVSASALVLALYANGIVFQWVAAAMGAGQIGNPLISLVCIGLLASCVRATLLSKRFLLEGDRDFPEGNSAGFLPALVDRLPKTIWPKARIAFFVLASLYLALSFFGSIRSLILMHKAQSAAMIVDAP